ncbi:MULTISPECIES: signal peptidase II [Ureibacillus]|uniref:signal peptidase II n=1 Tax=Ureibacillus TaxID=160795 RepID=UPI000BBC8CC5|nr:signal peptidase II [Ureibacillus thermosphaericus]
MFKYYVLALFIILIDQITKWFIVTRMQIGDRIGIWDPWIGILSHRNRGAAWGMLQGQMWIFYIVTIIVIVGVIYYFHKEGKNKPFLGVSLMILLGGAFGNFIDRVFRGEVVDFIDVFIPIIRYDFPIFNVADAALTISVVMLIIVILKEDQKEQRKVKQ